MRTVIIISRCLTESPGKPNFHFKGHFAGEFIATLQLKCNERTDWKKGEDYLMYVRVERVQGGILIGEVLRSRALDELVN